MTDTSEHPTGCMCETCKLLRQNEKFKNEQPEAYRQMKHARGSDSEPDEIIPNIPEGMTEREAIRRGII